MSKTMKIALFPGSFDPFTKGHEALVLRGLELFDKVVVAVGQNSAKQYQFPLEERLDAIRRTFDDNNRVEVLHYEDMTVDCCHRCGAQFILRGVRNAKDLEYERTVAAVNNSLDSGIETVVLFAEPEMAEVSSTVVRELLARGKDVKAYMPNN
ncbi:MAG: pantetheine-phosphate adenylyltransferase [Bacteroidales bacterium]|nr:pantetheine-phosphate adenylyltransferase [Candidatus Colimorpha pelethequi]